MCMFSFELKIQLISISVATSTNLYSENHVPENVQNICFEKLSVNN